MRKKNSIKSLTLKKTNIAQLNEKEIGTLKGGWSIFFTTFSQDDECTSLYCLP